MKYRKIFLTHIVELNPLELKASLVHGTGSFLSKTFKNFVNANFFSGVITIGWLISDGVVLASRHEGRKAWAKRKGTFIVYKDGNVEARAMYDWEIEEKLPRIHFCCQGFNLFPLDIASEGYNPSEVGYCTMAVSIGCNKTGKIIIAVRPKSDARQTQLTMKNLGCEGCAIRLDSGGSANLWIDGKPITSTARPLTNIIFWK